MDGAWLTNMSTAQHAGSLMSNFGDIWIAWQRWTDEDNEADDNWEIFEWDNHGMAWNLDAYGGQSALMQDLHGYMERAYPDGVPSELEIHLVRYTQQDVGYSIESIDVIKEFNAASE